MSTDHLISKLTKAISYQYKEDKTAPGLTVAALKKGFYCSVIRYDGAFAKGKVVVCYAKADTLDGALKEVAHKFLSVNKQQVKDPIQELNDLVRGI